MFLSTILAHTVHYFLTKSSTKLFVHTMVIWNLMASWANDSLKSSELCGPIEP